MNLNIKTQNYSQNNNKLHKIKLSMWQIANHSFQICLLSSLQYEFLYFILSLWNRQMTSNLYWEEFLLKNKYQKLPRCIKVFLPFVAIALQQYYINMVFKTNGTIKYNLSPAEKDIFLTKTYICIHDRKSKYDR